MGDAELDGRAVGPEVADELELEEVVADEPLVTIRNAKMLYLALQVLKSHSSLLGSSTQLMMP